MPSSAAKVNFTHFKPCQQWWMLFLQLGRSNHINKNKMKQLGSTSAKETHRMIIHILSIDYPYDINKLLFEPFPDRDCWLFCTAIICSFRFISAEYLRYSWLWVCNIDRSIDHEHIKHEFASSSGSNGRSNNQTSKRKWPWFTGKPGRSCVSKCI